MEPIDGKTVIPFNPPPEPSTLSTSERQELETLRREIRVLRKKFIEHHREENGSPMPIRLTYHRKGTPYGVTTITLVLDGVPELDSPLADDIVDAKKLAFAMAVEYKKIFGYKKIINIGFDGEKWLAEFEFGESGGDW